MSYTLDLTPAQAAITNKVRTLIGGSRLSGYDISDVYPDGLLQAQEVERYPNTTVIKPFIVLWFGSLRKKGGQGNFGSVKLDAHTASVDILVVADNGTKVRNIVNILDDELIGWGPGNTAGIEVLTKGASLWNDSRTVSLDNNNVPERWAATTNYEFVPFARKVTP